MTKLEDVMARNPEMSAEEITRVEVSRVSDPNLREAFLALVDFVTFVATSEESARAASDTAAHAASDTAAHAARALKQYEAQKVKPQREP